MKYLFKLSLVFLVMGVAGQADAVQVSFENLKKLVASRNERFLSSLKQAEAAREKEGYFGRSFLPKVSLETAYESYEVGSRYKESEPYHSLEASVNLYRGGKDFLESRIQSLKAEKRESESQIIFTEEIGKARELYWDLLFYKRELDLIEEMKLRNKKNLQAAHRRIQSGVATPSDRLEFEMKLLDLERVLQNIKSLQMSASFSLLAQLGYATDEPLVLQGELVHSDEWEHDLKHSHLDHSFMVRPFEIHVKELELQSEKEGRGWVPNLDVYAAWYQFNRREEEFENDRERQESVVGLRLSMDFGEVVTSRNKIRSLKKQALAAEFLRGFEQKRNEAHMEQEFLELRTLHDLVHSALKQIQLAEDYYRTSQKEYERGAKNSPDVLGATEKLEEAHRSYNQLLRDFQVARSHVLSKIGK